MFCSFRKLSHCLLSFLFYGIYINYLYGFWGYSLLHFKILFRKQDVQILKERKRGSYNNKTTPSYINMHLFLFDWLA